MSAREGQVVTVVGSDFQHTWELSCRFGLDMTVQGLYMTSTLVSCSVPVHGAGIVTLGVINNGVDAPASTVSFEYAAAMGGVTLVPSRGPVVGGSTVTVSGLTMEAEGGPVTCLFGAERGVGTVSADGTVVCTTPRVAKSGRVSVSVSSDSGQSSVVDELLFVYYDEPVVTKVYPERGALEGGNQLSVIGSGFSADGLQCRIGETVVGWPDARLVTSSAVLCVTPAASAAGDVPVEVSLNGGVDFTDDGRQYTYAVGASVSGARPSRGISGLEGQVVTVVGAHFEHTGELSCRFGHDGSVSALYMSSSLVSCSVPALGSGVVSVRVSNNGVDMSETGTLFTYGSHGATWSVEPSRGPTRGGTAVTVRGVEGAEGFESVFCMFGDDLVAGVSGAVQDDGTIVCLSPAGTDVGVMQVRLGEGPTRRDLGQSFTYEYFLGPHIYSLRPSVGGVTGGTVVSVIGSGFSEGAVACRFGEVVVTKEQARIVTSTVVSCVSPPGLAGGRSVEVSLNGGADFTNEAIKFLYAEEVSVSSVLPSRGTAGVDGLVVTVIGENFYHGSGLSCRFGSDGSVNALYSSTSVVLCSAPNRRAGAVRVDVSNNGCDWSMTGGRFSYEASDGAWALSPSRGPVRGGTLISVSQSGAGGDYNGVYCVFGASEVAAAAAETGGYTCVVPAAVGAGSVTVSVVEGMSRRKISTDLAYEYYDNAAVGGLMPSSGVLSGGTVVIVIGSGFTGSDAACQFGTTVVGVEQTRILSSTAMSCLSPSATSAGGVSLEVSLNGGADFTDDGINFVYGAGASVSASFSRIERCGREGCNCDWKRLPSGI
jgi:hypothetical protein